MTTRRELINEDSNQFGPGTDLIICLFALMMVFLLISLYLFSDQKAKADIGKKNLDESQAYTRNLESELAKLKGGEKFRLAGRFLAGTFNANPYYQLSDPDATAVTVDAVIERYRNQQGQFPFIFVVGHANEISIAGKPNLPEGERLMWNWQIAGARSTIIANLLQERLSVEERDRIVIVSTGEFDQINPEAPFSQENAFVEVLFGKDWKPSSFEDIR